MTKKHHYRYWQYRFLLLEAPNLREYKPEDYPLAVDSDVIPLMHKQVKWIMESYGTSLNPFTQLKS
ncbi:MAG: hypothetical protein ACJASB_000896 [Shewanella psychromarinicola]